MQQDENFQQQQFEATNGSGEAAENTEQKMNTNAEEDNDEEDERKIFVGKLSWETTTKDLKEYFEKYGEVQNANLKIDFETRKSRGFGFVVFANVESVAKVTEEAEHKLGGRTIFCKKANPRQVMKKVFVGRLDPSISEEEIKKYFEEQFGEVEKIERPYDKQKETRRSFAFVEFKKASSMKMCLAQTEHKIGTHELDVKTATPPSSGGQGFGRGGRGGRGGGRGGRGDFGGYGQGGYGGYEGYGYGGYGGYGAYDGGYGGYGDYGYGGGYGGGPWGGAGYAPSYGYGGQKRGYHPYNR